MGGKFSFPEREETSQAAQQPEMSSDGRGIEASESEARAAMIVENPNEALRPNYEPMGYGPPAYDPPGYSQYGGPAYGLGVPYDGAFYGADYMNNAAFGAQFEPGYGLPLETYDEDDVFLRSGGMAAMGAAYPGMGYPGGGMPGPPFMQRVYTVPEAQCDAMRYVQCLQDGILAVWGDERNPYFPQQFSKSASIYCYTDMKDGSMVISNRMIPNNVLIQTTPADTSNAPSQDNAENQQDKPKKNRKSKSSGKKRKPTVRLTDQETENRSKQEGGAKNEKSEITSKTDLSENKATEHTDSNEREETSKSTTSIQEHDSNASEGQTTPTDKSASDSKDTNTKDSNTGNMKESESKVKPTEDAIADKSPPENVVSEKEGTVLD